MKLAEISIKRPSLVIVLFTILILGGLFSYSQLGYELIPKFEQNVITVATIYPGASPSSRKYGNEKIEDAVALKTSKNRLSLLRKFIYGFHNAKHKSKS
jgi:HAE1 family hydrophobic/amphiphilic exporter-1